MREQAEKIIQQWISAMTYTVATRNLEDHMALISKSVSVHGMPSQHVIDYAGWHTRRHNEFTLGLLHSLTYRDVSILNAEKRQIHVQYREIMKGTSGQRFELHKDAKLHREHDNQWRLVREHIKQIRPLL